MYKIQAGLALYQNYVPEKHCENGTQNAHLKLCISRGLGDGKLQKLCISWGLRD